MKANPICRVCSIALTDETWNPSNRKRNNYICKSCNNKKSYSWYKAHPEKLKEKWTRASRKEGKRQFNENKGCSLYLGVHIAEQALSLAFKDVVKMPYGNPGYDFICNHGKKIDVKSSCLREGERNAKGWNFTINYNHIADYFLCLAFDNREDLTPLHVWLIPGSKLGSLSGTSISPTTIHKWDEYRIDITKISNCCEAIR